jgi:hypothetical protein
MLITEKITLTNNQRHITIDHMFGFLFCEYIKRINNMTKNEKRITNSWGELIPNIRQMCKTPYSIFKTIIISHLIIDFLNWKPYVKSVDVDRLRKFLYRRLKLNMHDDVISRHHSDFYTKDVEISILYFLSQKGMHFDKLDLMPNALIKLSSLCLYGKYILNKLFEEDFHEDKMLIFSNKNANERRQYHYDYGYKYKYRDSQRSEYNNVRFDYNEYSSATSGNDEIYSTTGQIYQTASTVQTMTTSGNTFNFMINSTGDDTSWTMTYPLAV